MNRKKIEISFGTSLPKKEAFPPIKNELSSSESEEDENLNEKDKYISKVNSAILNEQEETEGLINKMNKDPSINDYDNYYEPPPSQDNQNSIKEKDTKPKYMDKIMKAIEKRKNERFISQEKITAIKIEKETGKKIEEIPKFITKAYKEKLKQLGLDKEEIKENEDNTVNNKEFGMMGFYSNLLTKNKLYCKNEEGNINEELNEKEINKIVSKRKKEYEEILPKVDDSIIEKIAEREKKINSHNENNENKIKDVKDEKTINSYKERYLKRKKEREKI